MTPSRRKVVSSRPMEEKSRQQPVTGLMLHFGCEWHCTYVLRRPVLRMFCHRLGILCRRVPIALNLTLRAPPALTLASLHSRRQTRRRRRRDTSTSHATLGLLLRRFVGSLPCINQQRAGQLTFRTTTNSYLELIVLILFSHHGVVDTTQIQ